MTDIQRVFVAGGFGAYLDIGNAIQIGLLPDVPARAGHLHRQRVGDGRQDGPPVLRGAAPGRRRGRPEMTYRELSVDEAFMDEYVSAMFLPHTDCGRFPRACAALGFA